MHASLTAVGVVFVALFVGCSQPISPASPTVPSGGPSITSSSGDVTRLVDRVAAGKEVPFKGSLEGDFTFVPDSPPSPFASVDFTEVTGNATHLGRFTVEAPHRVNLSTVPATATGTFVFTAANGDTLTADFTGLGTPTDTPGIASIVETASITGGTGRFAGATGNFIVERSVDLVNSFTTGSFEGTISSPGASKH